MAQFGSALRSGRRGRRFEPGHPDHCLQGFASRVDYLESSLSVNLSVTDSEIFDFVSNSTASFREVSGCV